MGNPYITQRVQIRTLGGLLESKREKFLVWESKRESGIESTPGRMLTAILPTGRNLINMQRAMHQQ